MWVSVRNWAVRQEQAATGGQLWEFCKNVCPCSALAGCATGEILSPLGPLTPAAGLGLTLLVLLALRLGGDAFQGASEGLQFGDGDWSFGLGDGVGAAMWATSLYFCSPLQVRCFAAGPASCPLRLALCPRPAFPSCLHPQPWRRFQPWRHLQP